MTPKKTKAERHWENYHGMKPEGASLMWKTLRAARYEFGQHDWFEWEIGEHQGRFLLVLKYFTFADAWDFAIENIDSVKKAFEIAQKEAKIADKAYRKSQSKDETGKGWAKEEEVFQEIGLHRRY